MRGWAGLFLSAILLGLYTRGGMAWALGFVALVPWLRVLDTFDNQGSVAKTALHAWMMSVAFTAGSFFWFGAAIGNYTQAGEATGLAVLLLLAPLFQTQILLFSMVRYVTRLRYGPVWGAVSGAAAWVAAEWLLPKVLGDTLGYGLYPSSLMRQAADVGGAAGLTLSLLLCNEAFALALARRTDGLRAVAGPLAIATLVPVLLLVYGLLRLPALQTTPLTPADKPLRMGLVQSNIVDYERMRRDKGTALAVREILDTHYAMSYDAVERQHVDAVLWSETVYPTTLGHPKSPMGAELDHELLSLMRSAGVPFVFGTYDQDGAGEYNAAAFVSPGTGLLGMYRKTRLFPLTEYVPAWLDSSSLRNWLPWTGSWRAGDGARVFPLQLADGREIPVLPLICLDDVDSGLAIDGARLGAQAILTLSNDAWFSAWPQGAQLHQAVAAFRSIETRLPQFRGTTNGYSAVIDARGTVIASAAMGSRTLVVGDLPVRAPPMTLMVKWGNWVGLVASAFLALLAAIALFQRFAKPQAQHPPGQGLAFPVRVVVLPGAARWLAGLLRTLARAGLLWMGISMLLDDALRSNALAQMRLFAAVFLAPEAAAWCLLQAFSAQATLEDGKLVLTQGKRRLELALADIAGVQAWLLPIPGAGASVRLTSGERWPYALAVHKPAALARALDKAGVGLAPQGAPSPWQAYGQARTEVVRSRFDQAFLKFALLPLLLAVIAFRVHQNIAYGSTWGEYYTFGLMAYLSAFGLWWAAWTIGVVLVAAGLRAAVEAASLTVALLNPAYAQAARQWLERMGLVALCVGLPGWLLMQVLPS